MTLSATLVRAAAVLSATTFASWRFWLAGKDVELEVSTSPTPAIASAKATEWTADSLQSWGDVVLTRAPFTNPALLPASNPVATRPQSPAPQAVTLVLQGVVGAVGRYSALITGFPGQAGTVLVSAGDTLSGFRVRRVEATSVLMARTDSSFTLTLRPETP